MSSSCKVRVFGTVPVMRAQDGAHLTVPFGIYTLESLPQGRYRLFGVGLPTFELDRADVSTHMGIRMKVIEGCWP